MGSSLRFDIYLSNAEDAFEPVLPSTDFARLLFPITHLFKPFNGQCRSVRALDVCTSVSTL